MVYETRPIWLNPSNWLEVQCVVYLSTIKYRVPHVHNRCMSACVRACASERACGRVSMAKSKTCSEKPCVVRGVPSCGCFSAQTHSNVIAALGAQL